MEHEKAKLTKVEEANEKSENTAVKHEETLLDKDKKSKIIPSADPAATKKQVVTSNLAKKSTEKFGDEISSADALALVFAEMHISADSAEIKEASEADKPTVGQEVATNTGHSTENPSKDPKAEKKEAVLVNKMKKTVSVLPKRTKAFDFSKMVPDSESDSNSDY